MSSPDLARVMRVLAVARLSESAHILDRSEYTWEVIRKEARDAVGQGLYAEFDRFFPAWDPGPDQKPHAVSSATRSRLEFLIGWLEAIVEHETLEMRIRADAESDAILRRFPPRVSEDEEPADY